MIKCGKCNGTQDCNNCKFEEVDIRDNPCWDCIGDSEFVCKACEDEKIKQARFEKYLDEKEKKS